MQPTEWVLVIAGAAFVVVAIIDFLADNGSNGHAD